MNPHDRLSSQRERFRIALETLVGTGPIQDRLESAYVNLIGLQVSDFPEDVLEEYTELDEALTRLPAQGDEGTLAATTNAMSDEEAADAARKILHIFVLLVGHYRR